MIRQQTILKKNSGDRSIAHVYQEAAQSVYWATRTSCPAEQIEVRVGQQEQVA
jgi:hypothetical protein